MKHKIEIAVEKKKFKYNDPCICVERGDTIEWKLKNDFPYGIIIKAPVTPLDWCFKMTASGKKIVAVVRDDAPFGHYAYGVSAFDGAALLFDDPDIIVRPPGGRG
jgi:hypothetical protein